MNNSNTNNYYYAYVCTKNKQQFKNINKCFQIRSIKNHMATHQI